jgi:hypothetical protein
MNELELVGLSEDRDYILLRGPNGQEFTVRVNEKLRAAVRRDRVAMERIREISLTPREIQTRIRAGATAAELAAEEDVELDYVSRYAAAVEDERAYVASQGRAATIGSESDSPTLGDLVIDRLAGRGVDYESIEWDAFRPGDGPWTLTATFETTDATKVATWSYEPSTQALSALDDEARSLTETQLDAPIPLRPLERPEVFDVMAGQEDDTEQLLDNLRTRRGIRPVDSEDEPEDSFEGFGPRQVFDQQETSEETAAGADADVLPIPVPEPVRKPTPVKRARPSVPSWDEIVFGGRTE